MLFLVLFYFTIYMNKSVNPSQSLHVMDGECLKHTIRRTFYGGLSCASCALLRRTTHRRRMGIAIADYSLCRFAASLIVIIRSQNTKTTLHASLLWFCSLRHQRWRPVTVKVLRVASSSRIGTSE